MAEIKSTLYVSPWNGSGPSTEVFYARIRVRKIRLGEPMVEGGPLVEVAVLTLGNDTLEIWPVPDPIRDMIERMKQSGH